MKRRNLMLGLAVLGMAFTSCKNEKQVTAEKTVDRHVTYVDSVASISEEEAKTNWQAIDAAYQQHVMEAEAALPDAGDQEKAKERLEAAKAKYEELKMKLEAAAPVVDTVAVATPAAADAHQPLRDSFFGAGKLNNSLDFSWVNKDNILAVYENFWNTFKANEKSYSREQLDHIKNIYEALDARKNTVEKEGLSSGDNLKIAGIKMKFSPSFKWERMTSKGAENKDAKQAAK